MSGNSIFEGPICDECVNAFGSVDTKIAEIANHCGEVVDYLKTASNDYNSNDSSNSKGVQAVGSKNAKSNTNYSGKMKLDGNVFVIDQPVEKGQKYNLSQEDLEWVGNVADMNKDL